MTFLTKVKVINLFLLFMVIKAHKLTPFQLGVMTFSNLRLGYE